MTGDGWTPPPIDGAELLYDVEDFLVRFVAFPSEAARVAVTLWAAHTHLVARFESTPRLALLSPEKQCGKTRVLELLELLCVGAERLNDASPSYMFRAIGDGDITMMLDEADAIWKRGKADESAEALRSIVNSGHRKGASVGRVEMRGQTAVRVRFPTYAPTALAGIGNCLPDTILDRAVIVSMRRRAPGEQIAEYRERTTRPEGEQLRECLAAWAASMADRVGDPWPEMPPGVTDRPADVWEPLLAIADLAGGTWPDRARSACVEFVTGRQYDDDTIGVRLLGDLCEVFAGADVMATRTILDSLSAIAEAPWADWYGKPLGERGLAKMLRPYGVRSRQIRIGSATMKGYRAADLHDAWSRYLPAGVSETSETSETPLVRHVSDVSHVSDTPARSCDDQLTHSCSVCNTPMTVIYDAQTTHPGCEPGDCLPKDSP